jgi:hypothetical protein
MGKSARGWGPFTGGQLTVMVCVIAVVALFPVGAWALSFSNVAITDPGGVHQARVSATGSLSVTGSVTGSDALPTDLYQRAAFPNFGSYAPVAAPPAGKALVITSLSVDVYETPASFVQLYVSATDATCAAVSSAFVGFVDSSTVGLTTIPIPSGLVIPANRALCAKGGSAAVNSIVMTFGYTVKASAAPPGAGPAQTPLPERQG